MSSYYLFMFNVKRNTQLITYYRTNNKFLSIIYHLLNVNNHLLEYSFKANIIRLPFY